MNTAPQAMSQSARKSTAKARVHACTWRGHGRAADWRAARVGAEQIGAAKLDAAIEANLKGLGYGG